MKKKWKHSLDSFPNSNMKSIGLGTVLLSLALGLVNEAKAQGINRPDFFERGQEQLEREIQNLQQKNPAPSLTIEAESQPQQWYQLIFRAGGFSVWMPQGALTEETKVLETDAGEIAFQVLATNSQSSRFIVAYSDELTPERTENPEAILARVRDGIIEKTAFELIDDRAISLDEHPGKELRMRNSGETIAFRIYAIGQRLYVLGASQQNQGELSQTAIAFFNSFRLLG